MTDFDYGNDGNTEVTESGFAELDELVTKLRESSKQVEDLQEQLKAAQKMQATLSENAIPDLMEAMGLEEFKTKAGFKVSVSTKLRHSLSKERKPTAIAWLREHGHGDIVKNIVSVQFAVGEEDQAQELTSEMLQKFGGRAGRDEDVHSSTLKSLLGQMLKDGVDVPLDVFGAFEQKQTVITTPKS